MWPGSPRVRQRGRPDHGEEARLLTSQDSMTPAIAALIAGGIPCLLGAVFTTIGYVQRRTARAWMRGTAVILKGRSGIAGSPYPTFQWQDQHGQVHQRTSMMRTSFGPKTGSYVPILFDPNNPSCAIIDTFARNGQLLVLIGVIVFGFGILTGITTLVFGSAFAP